MTPNPSSVVLTPLRAADAVSRYHDREVTRIIRAMRRPLPPSPIKLARNIPQRLIPVLEDLFDRITGADELEAVRQYTAWEAGIRLHAVLWGATMVDLDGVSRARQAPEPPEELLLGFIDQTFAQTNPRTSVEGPRTIRVRPG